MKIRCTNTTVIHPVTGVELKVMQQLEVGGTVVYPLASGRTFETDFMVSLDTHISMAQATFDSYKVNTRNKQHASERLLILLEAKRIIEEMGDYHNVNGEIVRS